MAYSSSTSVNDIYLQDFGQRQSSSSVLDRSASRNGHLTPSQTGQGVYSQTTAAMSPQSATSDVPLNSSMERKEFAKETKNRSIPNDIAHRFVAAIAAAFFLCVVMTCALFSYFVRTRTPARLPEVQRQRDQTTTKNDKRLTMDLAYYANLLGLVMDEYEVTTSDGFILDLKRLHKQGQEPSGEPILMVHGLLQSSAAYLTSGKDSIAAYFVEQGYDVWLGDNRCGFKPKHTKYKKSDSRMWHWDITEMGTEDLPALVNYVLKVTGQEELIYFGHSQGTTQAFLGMSRDFYPALGHKIKLFVALAPAVYAGPLIDRWYFQYCRNMSFGRWKWSFGIHSYIPLMNTMHAIFPKKLYGFFGYIMFNYMFDWTDEWWDRNLRNRQFLYSPTFVSSELMQWWLGPNHFSKYRGILPDKAGVKWYDRNFPKLVLVIPTNDMLVDAEKIYERITQVETDVTLVETIRVADYSHLDVLWAMDVVDKVCKPVHEIIKNQEKEKSELPEIRLTS